MTTVICWVKPKVGEAKKYRSKNGQNFKDKVGNSYNAPAESKHEVMTTKTFWKGRTYWAFYKEGQSNPIPIDPETKWKQNTNNDSDIDVLVQVTSKALSENSAAQLERKLTMGGMGLVLLFLFFHHFF